MSRIIALDYGTKRTGIAVTDPLQLIASPLKIVPTHTAVDFLKEYLQKESVETIVVGWPLELNGQKGKSIRLVEQFIRLIKRHLAPVPIVRYDERFTSLSSKKSIIQAGIKKKKRKSLHIDDISATFILQSFMEGKVWHHQQKLSCS